MKLKFNPDLEYQKQAIDSVVNLFEGQPNQKGEFMIDITGPQQQLFDEIGVSNRLLISKEDILDNLKQIQLLNGLPQNKVLQQLDFQIEMETGTGKTYVFTRTMFELYKKYGFSKFIIVVPSLAIKEGIFKSLEITKNHFYYIYKEHISFFMYEGSEVGKLKDFATKDNITVMIMTMASFNKSNNILNRESHEDLGEYRPLSLIQDMNPVVIIDEPQSTSSTDKSWNAIRSLNPLCTLSYSATHKTKENLVYKLDAVDAFDHELVKQIQVSSFHSEENHNQAYMRLVSTNNKKLPITARIEIDVQGSKNTTRKVVTVRKGDDLYELSQGREVYSGYLVEEIYCKEGSEYVSFTSKPEILYIDKAIGDIDDDVIKNSQIRETIREHLDKELRLNPKGIKVLSLFFVDKVANYRSYDEDNNVVKGKYAKMFEENFLQIASEPKYAELFKNDDLEELSKVIHDGYFSQDRQGRVQETKTGNALADESAYNLIMKDKEKLLSFKTQLRFIFSHSALKEGWDNPNVFQICTLNETRSDMKKRQEVGRGLRLCVNQDGERQHGFDINTLSVMANESYDDFCNTLQKEYEEDGGVRFGVIQKHVFANIPVKEGDKYLPLGSEKSNLIFYSLLESEYIDKKGNVENKLIRALKDGDKIVLPDSVENVREEIEAQISKLAKGLPVKNAKNKRVIKRNDNVFRDEDFKELWNRIKYKSMYQVNVDEQELINKSVKALKGMIVPKSKLVYTQAKVSIDEKGVTNQEIERRPVEIQEFRDNLPDILSYLQNKTDLTRKTIAEILVKSDTYDQFIRNPQRYMEDAAFKLNEVKNSLLVDGIKYSRISNEEYCQSLFEDEELVGYIEENMIPSERSIYDYVVYDSEIEKGFAQKLEENKSIRVYAKLPSWFIIPTPLGDYNPDWAILLEVDNQKKLYFVVETKGGMRNPVMREIEKLKTDCGKKHFESLDSGVNYSIETNFDSFIVNAFNKD